MHDYSKLIRKNNGELWQFHKDLDNVIEKIRKDYDSYYYTLLRCSLSLSTIMGIAIVLIIKYFHKNMNFVFASGGFCFIRMNFLKNEAVAQC